MSPERPEPLDVKALATLSAGESIEGPKAHKDALKNIGFVAQYESWLATEGYLLAQMCQKPEPLEVAKFLGWTSKQVTNGKEYVQG